MKGFFATLAFTIFLVSSTAEAVVRRYEQTIISGAAENIPQWANYDTNAKVKGNRTFLSDDAQVLAPLNICIPFFQSRTPIPMYLSSNGFVTPMPRVMCQYYCVDNLYFDSSDPSSGGFPMIGLYVTDLNPESEGALYRWRGQKTIDGEPVEVAIAEFDSITTYNRYSKVSGQVELWENGTIILRYQNAYLDTWASSADQGAVGLIWTERQRYVAPPVASQVLNAPKYIALRYDPVPDPCAVNTACAACASAEGCVWCGNSNECVGTDVVDDVCAPTQRNGCQVPSLSGTDPIPQSFYTTQIRNNDPFVDITTHTNTTTISFNSLPAKLPLGMSMPFFSFHEERPNSTNPIVEYSDVFVALDFTLTFQASSQCASQAYTAEGGPRPTCRDSSYRNTIALFGAPMSNFANRNPLSTLLLPPRSNGEFLCTRPAGCPSSFAFQITRAFLYGNDGLAVTAQAVLSADGTIEVHYQSLFDNSTRAVPTADCPDSAAWYRQEGPVGGIFRNGNAAADPSSVPIPWTIMEAGLKVTFSPVPGCLDCGGKGYCDVITRKCVCKNNFVGEQCEECAPGYYGPQCIPCETCENNGVCSSGLDGSGFCEQCDSPFSGPRCNVTCAAASNALSTGCVGGCGMGYCLCGKCECVAGSGWYGERCERWADPCRKYTLFGCSACVASNAEDLVSCNWCSSDMLCAASSGAQRIRIGNTTACAGKIAQSTSARCRLPTIRPPADSKFAVITVIVVFACLGVCSCLTLLTVCLCRKHPYNPLVLGAVPGVPDFAFPRREREIIGISRLPTQGKNGRPVQGIPLKQIPMRDLVLLQRQRQKEKMEDICPISSIHADHHGL